MDKAVIIDRDGAINKKAAEHEYITSWEDFYFLPDVLAALNKIAKTDFKILIVTNQRGISRGKMSEEDLEEIHKNMLIKISEADGRIDKIYFCPHNNGECDCRKPLPGMLDKAKRDYNLDLDNSWVIGDSISDIKFGKSRNCKTIFVGSDPEAISLSDYFVESFNQAVDLIIESV